MVAPVIEEHKDSRLLRLASTQGFQKRRQSSGRHVEHVIVGKVFNHFLIAFTKSNTDGHITVPRIHVSIDGNRPKLRRLFASIAKFGGADGDQIVDVIGDGARMKLKIGWRSDWRSSRFGRFVVVGRHCRERQRGKMQKM